MYVALSCLFLLQEAWCFPADGNTGTAVSAQLSSGAQISSNFKTDWSTSLGNLRNGFSGLFNPFIRLGTEKAPELASKALNTVTTSTKKIVQAKAKAIQTVAVGAGRAVGGGMVLGSALIGGGMQLAGSGLGAIGGVIDTGAKAALNLTGNLADTAEIANTLLGSITGGALEMLGMGLSGAGSGANVMANGTSQVISAIGVGVSNSLASAQETLSKLMKIGVSIAKDGTVSFTNNLQASFYKALETYLKNLLNLETMMNNLSNSINSATDSAINKAASAIEEGAKIATEAVENAASAAGVALEESADAVGTLADSATQDDGTPKVEDANTKASR